MLTAHRWRVVLWTVALIGISWLIARAWGALVPFAVGAVVGYAMLPIVERVAVSLPIRNESLRRGISVFVVYVVFGGVMVYASWMFIPVIADQMARFVEAMPAHVETINRSLSYLFTEYRERVPEEVRQQVEASAQGAGDTLRGAATASVQRSLLFVTGTVSTLFGYFIVPFWLFYMLRDRPSLQRGILNATPPSLQDDIRHASLMVDHVIGRYVRAQLLLGLVVGTAVGMSLSLLGVELAAALGVWAGLTELVPIIGPWLGAIPGLLVVAATNPGLLLPVALVYFLVQQLENQFLVPRMQGQATDISAGMVILLLAIGGGAFGFTGLVAVVPAAAIVRELFWYVDRRLRGAAPDLAFGQSRAARDGHRRETAPVEEPVTSVEA